MSDKDQLALALNTQAARDNDANITDRVCQEIKGSVVFQYNWQDLLQSAPIAISSTGACYAAAFSDAGKRVQLEKPLSGKWTYLNNVSLGANLVECGDKGKLAFMEAETGLLFVKDISGRAQNKVVDIIDALADPASAKKLLKPFMGQLKTMADDAYNKVTSIDDKFEKWLLYTCELHSACVGTESSTAEKLTTTEINLAVQQTMFSSQKNTVADAKAMQDKLGKQLDVTSEAFKKASDNFPTGWDILGQQIVGSLADCATTALSSFVSAYTSNMNPMAKASSGVAMFDNVIHPKSGNTNGNTGTPGAGQQPVPPKPAQAPLPPYAHDPAYGFIQKDLPYLTALDSLLNKGPSNGVDWDSAVGSENASGSSSYILQMIAQAQSDLKNVATQDPPSVDLNGLLARSFEVVSAIDKEALQGKSAGHTFPAPDSDTVKGWQTKFKTAYTTAQTMAATARSMPGTSPQGIPLMANGPDPAVQIAQTNAKTAQAQATLDAAKNRLATTQDAYMKTQEVYAKNAELLLQQENKLTEIQGQLTALTQSKMGLTEVKQVLESCIKLVVNVKQNIMDLCTFFAAMSATIEAIVNYSVRDFLEQITADVSSDGNTSVIRIGDYTLDDYQRSNLFQAAVTVRGHFSVFGDIAGMWGNLSIKYITPGLKLLDQFTVATKDDERQRLISSLQTWATNSIDGVKQIADKTQKGILSDMDQRITDIQSVTKKLPPSPPVQQAITNGTNATANAATTAIQTNAASKPLNRFAGSRV